MGISLDYSTTQAVPHDVRQAIVDEAAQLAPDHDWWAESINFCPSESDNRLAGWTKIFLIGYSSGGGIVQVEIDDDSLMAYRDTCFVLNKLSRWSQQHSLTWEVSCAGEPMGTIVNGKWDERLRQHIDDMKQAFPWPDDFDAQVKEIADKYSSRWK